MEGPVNGKADCARAPKGFYCTKDAGHDGECDAWPKGATIKFTGPESTPAATKLVNKLLGIDVSRETRTPPSWTTTRDYAYAYPAEILRWVDGDTVDMRAWKTLDFGFHQKVTGEYTGRFRLTIVDTPERGEHGWAEATDYCKEMLPPGTVVQIRTYRDPDVFGRYLADIQIPGMGTTSISSLLLQNGLAEVWK